MSAYLAPSPDYAFNGNCNFNECREAIYGDAWVVTRSGVTFEYCLQCAITMELVCGECLKGECQCPEVLNEIQTLEAA